MSEKEIDAEEYRTLLKHRVKQLNKMLNMVNIQMPNIILANQVRMIYNVACVIFPEAMGKVMMDEQKTLIRLRGMQCVFCGSQDQLTRDQMQMCSTCYTEAKNMESEL